jgi:hypothetical protein
MKPNKNKNNNNNSIYLKPLLFHNNNETDNDKIILNRHKFIKEYKIKSNNFYNKIITNYFIYLQNNENTICFDYLEKCKTIDNNFILVNSSYEVTEEKHKYFQNNGWIKIYNLHNVHSISFIKIINKHQLIYLDQYLGEFNNPTYLQYLL